ncbi:hypothetical protein LTS09_003712 [Friedmanniomyces endolithicus]|nr:hypothetical protein LTS09_003712 [Friedmanniomyces endolithicus]
MKKKLVIAAVVTVDRDAFEHKITEAFSTPAAKTRKPGPPEDAKHTADAVNTKSTSASIIDDLFWTPDYINLALHPVYMKQKHSSKPKEAYRLVEVVSSFIADSAEATPISCRNCGTIGLHTTEDHEFATSLTNIRNSVPKSSTRTIATLRGKAIKPFTRTV